MALTRNRIHICPVETGLELFSGKWKPRILWKLHQEEVVRFGMLRRGLPNITAKMLTQQLRDLERDGLITRKVYAEVPPRVEYSLSPFGRSLRPILDQLAAWGVEHRTEIVDILEGQQTVR